jgi:hypothetical protein
MVLGVEDLVANRMEPMGPTVLAPLLDPAFGVPVHFLE